MTKGTKVKKGFHKTKDGRVVKKGLYYNMNQAKKKGTSKKEIQVWSYCKNLYC